MAIAKEIEGFDGYYISSAGNVWSEKRNGFFLKLKPRKDKDGYLMVCLCKDDKNYVKKVHRLVAQAFIPNPENKPCVDHINGIRADNRAEENLRWCTYKENSNFPLAKEHNSEAHKGEKHHNYGKHHSEETKIKISESHKGRKKPEGAGRQPKPVAQYTNDLVLVATYDSIKEASRQTEINWRNICSCCKGKRNYVGGYKWAYLN